MRKSHHILTLLFLATFILLLPSCKANKQTTDEGSTTTTQYNVPTFCEDSAMVYCNNQCSFGPRTMNSEAHEQCKDWIISKFKQFGCEVTTQEADLKGWDGTTLRSTNIIASLNKGVTPRVLICAHWDSRPWADNDPDESNHNKPVMAANDGASGVAVMLELARVAGDSLGIDFVCFDAEDYGNSNIEESWALGAQHFAQLCANAEPGSDLHNLRSTLSAAILLDMVGGQGAKFYQEGFSMHFAPNIVSDVWQAASAAGYGSFFPNEAGGTITDDHKPLNDIGIPTIDIIAYYPDCEQSGFGPTWHTVSDDMQHLDKNTLKAVGQTLLQYIITNRQ